MFVCSDGYTCIYPHSASLFGSQNALVQHNTFVLGGVILQDSNSGVRSMGDIIRDNVWTLGSNGIESPNGATFSNDHTLNSLQTGAGNLTGAPTFVGGAHPSSYAGYRLAPGSVGKGSASDGADMGIQ